MTGDGWSRYYACAGDTPRETLLYALDRFGDHVGFAVDLGCGTGRDTAELLRRGWRVLAIDFQVEAIERLQAWIGPAPNLETKVASFEEAVWPNANLVNASFSLPFCPPAAFPSVWDRIGGSLLPGGRFCGHLFGDRDEWATNRKPDAGEITFHTSEEVAAFLRPFVVERFEEVEEDGKTAVGDPKHWHLFNIVARKP